MSKYTVISWYRYMPIEDPQAEVAQHKSFMTERQMVGRIYVATEGINAQLSGEKGAAEEYMAWIRGRFPDVGFKCQGDSENVFPRLTVKVRKELVAMGERVDLAKGGVRVAPKQWREMLEEGDYLKIDVRNDYEWDLGHFKGFDKPDCKTFRDFPRYARKLKEKVDPKKTKVMMCCTGGIRCEVYSALMKEEGFEEVYQLDGGILKYGEEEQGRHWEGKLFVFDDRLGVEINQIEPSLTAKCFSCGKPTDGVFNCANMDCNELFFSCPDCVETHAGCHAEECRHGKRVRPQTKSKPFRKWYRYFDAKSPESSFAPREALPSTPA